MAMIRLITLPGGEAMLIDDSAGVCLRDVVAISVATPEQTRFDVRGSASVYLECSFADAVALLEADDVLAEPPTEEELHERKKAAAKRLHDIMFRSAD